MLNINQCIELSCTPKNIGKLIRLYRQYYNYKSSVVADFVGISQGNYSKLENGLIELSHTRLMQFCKLYNICPVDFYKHFDFSAES